MKRLPLLLLVIVLANPTNHLSGQSKTDPTARQARTIATERVPDMVLINRDQDRSQALAWFETMKKFDGRSATQSEIVSWYQYRLDWHQQRAPMGAIWKAVVVGATLAVGGVTAGIGRVGGLYTIDQMQESESLRLRSMRPEFKRLGRDNPETAMTLAKLILTKNAKAPDKTLVASFKNHPRALLSESVDESEGSHFERLAKGAIRSGENLRLHPKDAKALEEARQVTAKMNSMLDSFKRAQELENKGMSLVGLNEQERVRILNDITNVTNSAKQLGVLTHLSSDQQQQLDTAMNTVQLAATLIFATMTPTGYISTGLALATTLFGGSANQDPMQGVQAQLATISKQLQELQKSVNNLHQDVITGFSNISNELGEIRRQLDEQNALIRSGLEDVIAEIREISARDREKDWASLESEIDVYAKAKTSDERRVASDRVDRAFNQLMVSARLDGKAQAIAGPGLCWQRLHGDLAKDDLNAVDQEARRLVRDVNTATFGNRANCFFGMSQTVLDLLKVVNVPAVDLAAGPIAGTVISITEIGQDKPYQLIASTPLMEGEEDSEFGNPLLPVRLFRGGQLANASPFFVATFVQRGSAVLDRIPDATKRKELRLKLYAEFEPMIRSYGILHGRASASVLAGAYGRVQVALEEDLELMYRNPLAVALRDMDAWWDEFAQMFATPRNVIEQLGPLPKEPAPTAFTSNQADWYCYSSESLTQCLDRHAGPAVVKQLGGVIETPGIQRRRAIEKAKTVFTNRSQQVGSTMKRLLDNYIRHQQALRKAVGSVDGGQIQTPSVTINQVTSPFDPFVTFSSPQVTNDPPLPSETTAQAERAQLAGRSIYEVTRVFAQDLAKLLRCSNRHAFANSHVNPTPEHRGLAPGIADVSEECANSTTGPGLQFGWDGEGLNANAVKLSAFAKKKALEFRGGAERALGRVLSDRLGRTELDDQGIPIMTRRVTEKSLILQFIAQEMARRVREGVRPVKEVPEAQILEGSTALRPLIEHAQKTLAGKAMLADSMIRRVEEKTGERETIKVNIRWQENDRGSLGKPYLYKALDINLETGGFVSSDEAIRRVNDFRVKPAASTATTIEQRARETLAKTKDQWVAQNPGLLFALAVTDMLRKDNLGPQPASK